MARGNIVKIVSEVPGPKSRQLYSEMEQNVPELLQLQMLRGPVVI